MSGNAKEVNYLELSDEELMNMPPPPLDLSATEKKDDEEDDSNGSVNTDKNTPPTDDSEDKDDEEGDKDGDGDSDESDESADPDAGDAADDEGETEKSAKADADKASKAEADDPAKSESNDETKDKEAAIDYEAEYKKLMAPFKANGREVTPKSVEDAIALMQMGANYNKKMAALKPNLRLMKMLENNGLLDEQKLSFLIDVDKKNPDAISKLIKDSGLDPMDLDPDKASGYKGTTYTVDEREIDLDVVLDEIQGTPAYSRTLEIVGTKWDSASKQMIAQQPALLRVINDHVERGIYDIINAEIENERLFGRLSGMSYLEAYRHVGDAIQARGGFNHLAGPQGNSQPEIVKAEDPKSKKAEDDKLREKRRAASPTKPSIPKKVNEDFNPLALSDEEFSKLATSKYL